MSRRSALRQVDHARGCPCAVGDQGPTRCQQVARWSLRLIVVSLAATLLEVAAVLIGGPNPITTVLMVVSGVGIALPALVLVLLIEVGLVRHILRGLEQATTPLPSPAAVAEQFRTEHGRYPTAGEIQIVYTYLRDQHRQGLVAAGVVLGGLAVAAHGSA